ncbi:MAG: zinc ribbon domain-containing protein [Chloroflexi bacterium]|nr:zinc ribbon domain-containing protein [Chloroflexota bacterium]MCL5274176.1 zinc ribbon domain-containing protein [Chloroflexota bacterium]
MENISNLIVTAVAVIGAITAALIGGLTIWTFRDIRSRSRDVLVQILATVIVGVIPIAGILVYFMLRPRETLSEGYVRALEEESLLATIEHQEFCPSCGRRVDDDMVYCPSCHTTLRNSCPNCHRAVHLSWDLCPYCGETLQPETPVINKPTHRRVQAVPVQSSPSLPPSSAQTNPSLVSGDGEKTVGAGFSGMLDKIGGAIEGLMDRMSSRGSSTVQPNYTQNTEQAEESAPVPPYSRPRPAGDENKTATAPIKPLISREESLE